MTRVAHTHCPSDEQVDYKSDTGTEVILSWLPPVARATRAASLRRGLDRPDRPDLCEAPAAV